MNIIGRTLYDSILNKITPSKAVLMFGPRRVGKTVLMKQIVSSWRGKSLVLNGEDLMVSEMLSVRTISNYKGLFSGVSLLAIDEAQNIANIGQVLKLIVDEVPGIAVLATGSSSFDLLKKVGDPLVGRATQFMLCPLSQEEISQEETPIESISSLENRLIYGSYPEVYNIENTADKADYLRDIVNAYLLKDILMIDGIKNSAKMKQLLRLIALQVGSEVSLEELGKQLGMSRNTIERYLDLLEKVFVIYRLGAFSRNLRNEITRGGKWYFVDNGIRNAVIGNFMPLSSRSDIGALWENYLISERLKCNNNHRMHNSYYFWRTYTQKEIDLIEETPSGQIQAFEFKWGNKEPKVPADFKKGYPNAIYTVVSKNNYLEFTSAK